MFNMVLCWVGWMWVGRHGSSELFSTRPARESWFLSGDKANRINPTFFDILLKAMLIG